MFFTTHIDIFQKVWSNLASEGVASEQTQQVNILAFLGLACFKLRDSCMQIAIHGVFYISDAKYG